MSSTYVGNPTHAAAPSAAPSLTTYVEVQQPSDGDDVDAASVAQAPIATADRIAYLTDRMLDLYFGTGVDGAFSISATLSLSGSQYYTTFAWTGGALSTCGWAIVARTSITLQNCTVSGNGLGPTGSTSNGYGGTGASGPHGFVGIDGTPLGYGNSSLAVTKIGLGGAANGNTLLPPGNQHKTPPYRYACGYGLGPQSLIYNTISLENYPSQSATFDGICGGAAGLPGAGNGSPGPGGAGGTGGALIVLMAPSIVLNNVTFTSNGSAGGPGGGAGAGGGNGGGGGAFLFVGQSVTQSGCTYTANGGNGGSPGSGGAAGSAGSNGNTTPTIVIVP